LRSRFAAGQGGAGSACSSIDLAGFADHRERWLGLRITVRDGGLDCSCHRRWPPTSAAPNPPRTVASLATLSPPPPRLTSGCLISTGSSPPLGNLRLLPLGNRPPRRRTATPSTRLRRQEKVLLLPMLLALAPLLSLPRTSLLIRLP
jgi:hypothetical protein